MSARAGSKKLVDNVLEPFLSPALVGAYVALREDIRLEVGQTRFAVLDHAPERAVPALVAFMEEGVYPAIVADRAGDLESAGKRVHRADVRIEQVDRLEALP